MTLIQQGKRWNANKIIHSNTYGLKPQVTQAHCLCHMGFITWVNLENQYGVKFRSGNLLENGNRNQWNFPCGELLLSLIRRTGSFEKNNLLHLFYICFSSSWNSDMKKKQKCKLCRKDEGDYFSRNFLCILRTTTTRHMVSFIDFDFRFLANCQT